ncbi:hypothetical protein CROQUDRAFT_672781 [Cronartium quercuum f. sp. fusiforme G11]|uniref:Nascent polypeptide-associated complex subunit alpha-like UBA domain-containing protein n=1 Tax=Cronartium quercuum f. sp. fusiforme G11 TaxID=708437 RepID=A0A9P6ND55_9BASI|nr:hypothetical protein CROQUDRAFT_672781 [Cronartium quercuum f. sp. fusiforme G11]
MSASTSRQIQVPGATVISYYADADGQFGNIKVGFDVTRFDNAVRDLLFLNEFRSKDTTTTTSTTNQTDLKEKITELTIKDVPNGSNDITQSIQLVKEDIQLICKQLEVSSKVAEKALLNSHGNLKEALLYLVRQ